MGGANDDGSSLIVLSTGSPLLSAFNVLDGLRGEEMENTDGCGKVSLHSETDLR